MKALLLALFACTLIIACGEKKEENTDPPQKQERIEEDGTDTTTTNLPVHVIDTTGTPEVPDTKCKGTDEEFYARYGKGIMRVQCTAGEKVNFRYDLMTPEDGGASLILEDPDNTGFLSINSKEKGKDFFKPYSNSIEYDLLEFVWTEGKEGSMDREVIVNMDTGEKMWCFDNEEMTFYTWEQYLTEVILSVSIPRNQGIAVMDQPNDGANLLAFPENGDHYKVKSVKGDWIEIIPEDICGEMPATNFKSGWVKWRCGDQMLIYIALIC